MQGTREVRAALRAGTEVRSLAALILVALEDAQKLHRGRYSAHHNLWHFVRERPIDHGGTRCNICLAGMVMAGTLGASRGLTIYPSCFGDVTGRALMALDNARIGRWRQAYRFLTGRIGTKEMLRTKVEPDEWPPEPEHGGFEHWSDFDALVEELRKAVPVLRAIERRVFHREDA